MTIVALPFPLNSTAFFRGAVDDPLSLLRVVNCSPNNDWKIEHYYGVNQQRKIRISTSALIKLEAIVSLLVPWIASINRITIELGRTVFKCEISELTPAEREVSHLDFAAADRDGNESFATVLLDFVSSDPMSNKLTDTNAIEKYIYRSTWFGSEKYRGKDKVLEVIVGPTVSKMKVIAGERRHPSVLKIKKKSSSFDTSSVSYSYTRNNSGQDVAFRSSEMGDFDFKDVVYLQVRIGQIKFPNGVYEIEHPLDKAAIGGLPSLDQLNSLFVDEFVQFIVSVVEHSEYKNFLKKLEQEALIRSAKLLDERKHALVSSDYVFCDERIVYKVPKNENELISLHQKLEGMGAVPLAEFISLEFTPQLGIDAIASFKVRKGDSVQKYGGVEFEFKLESYFKHGHPEGQTDVIVCWTAKGFKELTLKADPEYQWLYYLTFNTKKIPVVCVEKYPKISIGKVV